MLYYIPSMGINWSFIPMNFLFHSLNGDWIKLIPFKFVVYTQNGNETPIITSHMEIYHYQ